MEIGAASDQALLVTFGDVISAEMQGAVLRLFRRLRAAPEVRNLHPAYASLLVEFDPLRTEPAELEERIRREAAAAAHDALPAAKRVEIPVRYGGEEGPDLEEVAHLNGVAPEEVVAIHSAVEYVVYFLGFAPGFPYLGGLSERIAAPRLASPRRRVPAGSVAIGGSQTGIYPVASPGGWRIIGRTALELFRAERTPPALLEMGDRVRFVPL